MPGFSVSPCTAMFNNEVSTVKQAVQEINLYRIEISPGVYHVLNNRTNELLICLQFLRMHLCWEGFIEAVLVRYLCGCSSPSGFTPTIVSSKTRNIRDAMQIISGNARYVSWSPGETIKRARVHFDNGEPFSSALSSALYQLNCISAIRNRIAHRSDFAKERFRETVRTEIGYNPRGMTPGRFLMMKRKISPRRRGTYFQYYSDILLALARQIAP